jgi:hypothetical protein
VVRFAAMGGATYLVVADGVNYERASSKSTGSSAIRR